MTTQVEAPPAQGNTASWVFTAIFAALGFALLAVEIYGIRRKGRMDTISEHYWYLQERFPWLHVLLLVSLIWVYLHLAWRLL